jgi:hypothetical protein
MGGLLQILTRRNDRYGKRTKVELLGSNPLFYKVLTVDKKIYKIKRRRWN